MSCPDPLFVQNPEFYLCLLFLKDKSLSKNYHGMPLHFLSELSDNNEFSWIKNKLLFKNFIL